MERKNSILSSQKDIQSQKYKSRPVSMISGDNDSSIRVFTSQQDNKHDIPANYWFEYQVLDNDKITVKKCHDVDTQKKEVIKIRKSKKWEDNSLEEKTLDLLKDCEHAVQVQKLYKTIYVEEAGEASSSDVIQTRIKVKNYYTEEEIFYILNQLFIPLKIIHHSKIVHCDIKPSNIILVKNPNSKKITYKFIYSYL